MHLQCMDLQKEISEWLSNPSRDYRQGAAIYAKYGKNKNLSRLFSIKPDVASTQEKMVYELSKLAEAPVTVVKIKPVRRKKRPRKDVKPAAAVITPDEAKSLVKLPKSKFSKKEYDALPEEMKKLVAEWKRLFKERAALRATLKFLDKANAHTTAELILEYGDTIQQIFDDIAYYKEYGFLPDREGQKDKIPEDLAAVEKALKNVNSRISKLKRKEKSDEVHEKMKAEQELKELLTQKRTDLQNNG